MFLKMLSIKLHIINNMFHMCDGRSRFYPKIGNFEKGFRAWNNCIMGSRYSNNKNKQKGSYRIHMNHIGVARMILSSRCYLNAETLPRCFQLLSPNSAIPPICIHVYEPSYMMGGFATLFYSTNFNIFGYGNPKIWVINNQLQPLDSWVILLHWVDLIPVEHQKPQFSLNS